MTESRMQHDAAPGCTGGMDRFFSPANLIRYRKLATGAIDDRERFRILKVLGEELKAFKREARATALTPTADTKPLSQLGHPDERKLV